MQSSVEWIQTQVVKNKLIGHTVDLKSMQICLCFHGSGKHMKIQGCIKISSTVMIQMTFQLCKLGISWQAPVSIIKCIHDFKSSFATENVL